MLLKWLKVHQYNLRMKFLSLNVDFISESPDPLGPRRPAHVGVKEGYSLESCHFSAENMKA